MVRELRNDLDTFICLRAGHSVVFGGQRPSSITQ